MKVFVLYDSENRAAYNVCAHSILKNSKRPNDIDIVPLDISELENPEFAQYYIPELMRYEGLALFVHYRMVVLGDIEKIFKLSNTNFRAMKVEGDEDNVMVLWNCAHMENRSLASTIINDPTEKQAVENTLTPKAGKMGYIPSYWRIINTDNVPDNPKGIYYRDGGPWDKDYERCSLAVEWLLMEKDYNKAVSKAKKDRLGPFDNFTPQKEDLMHEVLRYSIDPDGNFYNASLKTIEEKVKAMGEKIAAIDSEGGIAYTSKGLDYDPYLADFIHGSGGHISNWSMEENTDSTLVIRGLGGGSRKAIVHCWNNSRPFYAIDTGYFGNGKKKVVHRVTKDALQYLGPIYERDPSRAKQFGYKFRKFTPGSKILIVPPSNKVMDLFGQPAPEDWVKQVNAEIRKYTDRPIEIRLKPNRTERVTNKTIQAALAEDVHCLVTFNSIAAVEALMEGKPAIVLGQNAASVICETSLENIDNPKIPDQDTMDAYIANLAYQQFTVNELRSGFAWSTLNESSELSLWDPSKK